MARHADVVDDDEFAWQSPKPKKKKKRKKKSNKTSSVRSKGGAKKSAGSSGNLRASGKSRKRSSSAKSKGARSSSSGVRKSGKRRSSSGRNSGDEMNASGRRSGRRGAPARGKKKGVDPIIIISLITGTLLLCGGIIVISQTSSSGPAARDEPLMMEKAEKMRDEGMAAFRAWSKAQRDGPPAVEKAKHREALQKLKNYMDMMNKILEPHRDSSGMTKPEFEGWEANMAEVAPYIVDLEKGAKMDVGN